MKLNSMKLLFGTSVALLMSLSISAANAETSAKRKPSSDTSYCGKVNVLIADGDQLQVGVSDPPKSANDRTIRPVAAVARMPLVQQALLASHAAGTRVCVSFSDSNYREIIAVRTSINSD